MWLLLACARDAEPSKRPSTSSDDPGEIEWDADGDGFTKEEVGGSDCDDGDPAVHPDADERCDTEADDDCDGEVGEADAVDCETFSVDADGDGAGGTVSYCACMAPPGTVAGGWTDCDDTDPTVQEVCVGSGDHSVGEADAQVAALHAEQTVVEVGDLDEDGLPEVAIVGGWRAAAFELPLAGDRDPLAPDYGLDAGVRSAIGVAHAADFDGDGAREIPWRSPTRLGFATPSAGWLSVDEADGTGVVGRVEAHVTLGDADADGLAELALVEAGFGVWLVEAPLPEDSGPAHVALPPTGEFGAMPVAVSVDLDGTGILDLVVGDAAALVDGESRGAAHVVFDPRPYTDAEVDVTLVAPCLECRLGEGVARAGDVDGDGRDDVLVVSPGGEGGGGGVYVVTGDAVSEDIGDVALAMFTGEPLAPAMAMSAADLDGDGEVDLAVGAPTADVLAPDDGAVNVVFGPIAGKLGPADVDGRWFGDAGDGVGSDVLALTANPDDAWLWIGSRSLTSWVVTAGAR
ncbi:MAG: FG-GAP-like repeat-containing protein [Myxococcota bacterium]